MSCRLLFFLPEYRQYSTTEDKQTEGSRCKGVDHSLLVCCNGHLAVTWAGTSKKEWFAPLYFMIEIMKKTLLTICVLLLASWNAVVAQVNPDKVHKIGDRTALTLSTEFNQLQVKDKGVKADSEEETWVAYAVGTYIHGASGSLYVNAFGQEVPNKLGKYAPSQKYDAVLYRSSKKSNRYVIEPYMNGQQLSFQVDNATGYVVVAGSSSGMQGNAGTIVVVDSYSVLGEYPSEFNEEAGVIDFYLLLGDNQYYYGVDHDQFVITEYVTHGTCGKNGGDNVIWQLDLETGELLIHGSGEMEDYIAYIQPWAGLRDKISSIRIAEGVTNVGAGAFALHEKIKNVELPNSITSIGDHAFKTCSGLTSLELPNSITSIGDFAFYGCSGLSHLVFPNSITSIGYAVVYGCSNLTNFVIPNSVTSIGDYAMNSCSSLKNIFIPHSVESIGKHAFYGCSELQSVVMGNSVTAIGAGAFGGCSGLTSIVVATNNPVYDSREDCNAIVETATNTLIAGCKETFIPNSVTSIGRSAFYDCSGLTSLELSNSITSIGDFAFYGCSGLSRLVLPNSITSIGEAVVYGCSNLTNLVIPNSVTSIGDHAMNRCSSLKNIFIPNSVESIGTYAFYGCSELQSVVMGNSVTAIGEGGFGGCDKLDTIKMLGEIPPTAFDNTFSNYDATLYVPIGSAGIYRSADVWTNFSLIEEFDATGIENVETIVGKNVSVYTTNGKLVQQIPNYNGAPLRLPKGVYVVRAGKETKKVLVK